MNKEKDFDELVTLKQKEASREKKILSKIMLFFENLVKVPLFKCQRCGECILSHTGFVCPQRCPKRLRNGPCGGTRTNGHCEVYPERKCVWYMAYKRASRLKRTSLLHRIEKIHNWELEKTSAWLNVWTKQIEPPTFIIRSDDRHDFKKQD